MNAMDSIKDLNESLNSWLTTGMGGHHPSENLLKTLWDLTGLDMEDGTKREIERLEAVVTSLVEALPADTPEPLMATARRAVAAVQEFSPKAVGQVEVVGLMLAFQLLRLTALQTVYRTMKNPSADLTAYFEGV